MQSQVKGRKMGNYFEKSICFSYPQEFLDLKDELLSAAEYHEVTFVPAEMENLHPSEEFMEGLHLDPQNRTHIMVAKALMAALNKAATQAKSSLKMEFLAANNIVFPGSRIDYLEREVADLSEVVSSLEQRVDSLFPQVNNAPGSVTASSSSSAPFQRSQREKRYSAEAKEDEDNEHDGQTVRKRPRHGSSSSSTVQASPSPTGRLCSSRGQPAKL